MHSHATSFKYFCNNVRAAKKDWEAGRGGRKGREKWGGTTVTGATRDMSQCLAWSFSCRYCQYEIDNGTVQMTFLACIPAACGQSCTAEVLFRNDSVCFSGILKIIVVTERSLLFCGSVYERVLKPADPERWISSCFHRSPNIIPLEESFKRSL